MRTCQFLGPLAIFLGAVTAGPAFAADSDATLWQRWEQSLTSTAAYANPYRDVTLQVTFTSPSGRMIDGYGFWDGGNTFKVRTLFDEVGAWTWQTTASNAADAGLHNQSGSVDVAAYSGPANPLYDHGMVQVDPSRRHLSYADATPMFWLGDTAWIAPMRATQAEWEAYCDDRAARGFNVVQISPASKWSDTPTDTEGNPPFQMGSTDTSLVQWNPAYWQGYEEKVAYANAKGLTVLMVGVDEPVERFPNEEDAELFARNIAARLGGNHVIFSPAFDLHPALENRTIANFVGGVLDDALGGENRRHLITEHPNTSSSTASDGAWYNTGANLWFGEEYLDFSAFQSGYQGGDRQKVYRAAVQMSLSIYNKTTGDGQHKPGINLEAYYDSQGPHGSAIWDGTAKDARDCAYLSALSGSAGYTYGASGIYEWGLYEYKTGLEWDDAIELDSADQMEYFQAFFNAIDWQKLVPHHELVKNQNTTDWMKYIPLAASEDGTLLVAYLPDNASALIDLSGYAEPMSGTWFNPLTGQYLPIAGQIPGGGDQTFTKPAGWGEAVLTLTPVPEPATMGLLTLGGIALLRRRRR